MKFISWNIDSINAALTGTSPRSDLSRQVLDTIAKDNPDIIAIQETKLPENGMNAKQEEALKAYFPDYEYVYVSSREPARKGYAGTMALFKKDELFTPLFRRITLHLKDHDVRMVRGGAGWKTARVTVDGVPLEGRTLTHGRLLEARRICYE